MHKHEVRTDDVRNHFDSLADSYDEIKQKNWYYYKWLKKTIIEVIPPGQKVLDIGTGTGEVLNHLKPSKGIGLDLSPKLIEKARQKFPHLTFESASYENFKPQDNFDYILLTDVIEHVEHPNRLFWCLRQFSGPQTTVVFTMANPIWEPFLELLEKLKLKMDEGPHYRVSTTGTLKLAREAGFEITSKSCHLIFPFYIPLISPLINNGLGRLPLIRNLALIMRLTFKINQKSPTLTSGVKIG